MKTRNCLIACCCALLLTLTACGGGPEPPVNYAYETGDSLPSLSAALLLPEETSFSQEEDGAPAAALA